jgi:hypothetical protein
MNTAGVGSDLPHHPSSRIIPSMHTSPPSTPTTGRKRKEAERRPLEKMTHEDKDRIGGWVGHSLCSFCAWPDCSHELPQRICYCCFICFPGVTTHCGCTFTARKRALASSCSRFLDHTRRRAKVGRTPLDEWSIRRRDLYLTTHNIHNRQTFTPPPRGGIRTHNLSIKREAEGLRPHGHWDRLSYVCGAWKLIADFIEPCTGTYSVSDKSAHLQVVYSLDLC